AVTPAVWIRGVIVAARRGTTGHDDDVPDVLVRHRALGRPPGTRARADVPRADADVSGCDAPAEDRAPAWVRGVLDGL
uniref:hypothetical protein n=1 Tax=Pseudonocardia dioxanivorans TaxID=240495 RepID=UPI00131A4AEA